jgi:SPP1 family phage portal protein
MTYQIMADSREITTQNISDWLTAFKKCILPERQKLGDYYDGKNAIVKQGAVKGRPNYSINVNMAKYIIDVATAYAFGNPIKYTTDNENATQILDKLQYIHKNCCISELDFQQGGDMSTFGVAYQLIMAQVGEGKIEDRILFKNLNPLQTFYVVDNTILENPVCAIYFYEYIESKQRKTKIYVYDNENLTILNGSLYNLAVESVEPHNMGAIPIIQCLNNDDAFSDIHCITDLLDSLSLAVSNSTDNLQSIANAILAISGGTINEEQLKLINQEKTMNLPVGATAEWIIKNIDPTAEQQQVDNLLNFIFQIAQVPDLTDDAFAGNQSGVAMQYKLWGLDQLWVTKTTKYKKAIVQRLKILFHLLQYQFASTVQMLDEINITFDKNLPRDNSAEYTMVNTLKDVVSRKTLLENISIVDDVEAEIEALDEEAQKTADLYAFNNNKDLNGGADADEQE